MEIGKLLACLRAIVASVVLDSEHTLTVLYKYIYIYTYIKQSILVSHVQENRLWKEIPQQPVPVPV